MLLFTYHCSCVIVHISLFTRYCSRTLFTHYCSHTIL
ncbi:hypothetical protein SLEP1_g18878 [Rubroshorea leprosula]|uniref:Uncharacterized protein n=1 Tax=Rubroshorea leprosula TaxID=152421 RepID=A0AAV5J868_9ROSI|nr:hypothetical protein SLEP1_g18878 [Rubroshorea leprosula]